MATGLTVSDDDISVGGRVSPGAQLSRVKVYQFTDSTDATAVDITGPGHTVLGTSQSIVFPTKGLVGFAISCQGVTGGGENLVLVPGLRISGTNVFTQGTSGGATHYGSIAEINSQNLTVAFTNVVERMGAVTATTVEAQPSAFLDIEQSGLATGTQTAEFIYANSKASTVDIQGSTGFTSRGYLSVWDFT